MTRIGIVGAVGTNLGDEAIAVAAWRGLRALDPGLDISVATAVAGALRERYPEIEEFHLQRGTPAGLLRLAGWMSSLDAVLLGGGSLIQDKLGITPLRGMIPYVAQVVLLAKALRKPVHTLPIGIDRLETGLGRAFAGPVLRALDSLAVRDGGSLALGRRYAGPRPAIRLATDPAFALEGFAAGSPFPAEPAPFAISLVRENLDLRHLLPELLEGMIELLRKGQPLVLIPMDRKAEEEQALYGELLERIPADLRGLVRVLPPDASLEEVVRTLRSARGLMAMRLHAAILALGYTPVFLLSRTTKTEQLALEFGLGWADIADPECGVKARRWLAALLDGSGGEHQRVLDARAQRERKMTALASLYGDLIAAVRAGT